MSITGQLLIGAARVRGHNREFRARDAHTGLPYGPVYGSATLDDLDLACTLADAAFDPYRESTLEARAAFLETIGHNIMAAGDALINHAMVETGLPRARLEGERERTVSQLALFAAVVRSGDFLDARIDPALPQRLPLPRVDLRMRNIALGPVAIFGASNFPLAFSVAGGDTASALAAGCPVIVKAHPAHPGTSELVGLAIQQAVRSCALPEGVFSLLFDTDHTISQALVAERRIQAVGFTGSRAGGLALLNIAQARAVPIPVYAEMSAINPVILLAEALAERSNAIAQQFIASLTLGAGQFCTNPGLVLAVDSPAARAFEQAAAAALTQTPAATMLTPDIHANYRAGIERLRAHAAVELLAEGAAGGRYDAQAALFITSADVFLAHAILREEIFGPVSLLVRCSDIGALHQLLHALEGQLTAAVHLDAADHQVFRSLLPTLEKKAGRILVNGFGTGVEVAHAMVHGGPFPATSDSRTTAVGSRAIERFLRPVAYQNLPDSLLPAALRDHNPLNITQRINGVATEATNRHD